MAADPETYLAEVESLCASDGRLTPLGGGILAGMALDIVHDSRGFSRIFGIEHAIILREVQCLAEIGRLTITRRDDRTQRCVYASAA